MTRVTSLQRQFAEGAFRLPAARPASVSERAWRLLVRHVRDRVPYAALAAEVHIGPRTVQELVERTAAALRYPDLADLPTECRHLLVRGGYTTREAIARASDAELLLLKGMSPARLRDVRAVIPRAE